MAYRRKKNFQIFDQHKRKLVFEEKAYAFIFHAELRTQYCQYCGKKRSEGSQISCSQCKSTHYCSHECRYEDSKVHSFAECEAFGKFRKNLNEPSDESFAEKLQTLIYSTDVLLAVRMISRYKVENAFPDITDWVVKSDYELKSICQLFNFPRTMFMAVHHEEHALINIRNEGVWNIFKEIFGGVESLELLMEEKFFCEIVAMLDCNCFACYDEEKPIGNSFYLNATRFNHSCNPHMIYEFSESHNIRMYWVRGFHKELSELTKESFQDLRISYHHAVDNGLALAKPRMDKLWRTWHFTCTCTHCIEGRQKDELKLYSLKEMCRSCQMPYVFDPNVSDNSAHCFKCKNVKIIAKERYGKLEKLVTETYDENGELNPGRELSEAVGLGLHPVTNLLLFKYHEEKFKNAVALCVVDRKARKANGSKDKNWLRTQARLGQRVLKTYHYYTQWDDSESEWQFDAELWTGYFLRKSNEIIKAKKVIEKLIRRWGFYSNPYGWVHDDYMKAAIKELKRIKEVITKERTLPKLSSSESEIGTDKDGELSMVTSSESIAMQNKVHHLLDAGGDRRPVVVRRSQSDPQIWSKPVGRRRLEKNSLVVLESMEAGGQAADNLAERDSSWVRSRLIAAR